MKKTLSTIALLLTSQAFAAQYSFDSATRGKEVELIKSRNEIAVQFSISTMETKASKYLAPVRGQFQDLEFKDLNVTSEVGEPALPFYSVIVEGKPSDLSISLENTRSVETLSVLPAPAQKEDMRCIGCENTEFSLNWSSYDQRSALTKTEYLGSFRGVELTRVTVKPAYMQDGELKIMPNAKFSIQGARSEFSAPESIIEKAELDNRYLIITPEMFVESLQPFVEWKTELGFEVEVYTLEEIGNYTDAVDRFLQKMYNDEATRYTYALLVGGEYVFPTEYVNTSASSKTPSDLYYFTMDGESDFVPDVFYGRFVVETAEDVANQVAKIMEYEQRDIEDNSGFARHIGIASNEGYNPSDIEYVQQMVKPFIEEFGVEPFYFFQGNSGATPSNINKVMSSGAAFLNYIGHGSGTSWPSMQGSYTTSHLKDITPGKVKPVVIDVACANGKFVKGRLGERLMNQTVSSQPVGAVAYYGGSVNISWHPPAIMAVGINEQVQKQELTTLGEAILAGQFHLSSNYSTLSSVIDNYEWYHLFGDPSLKLNIGL